VAVEDKETSTYQSQFLCLRFDLSQLILRIKVQAYNPTPLSNGPVNRNTFCEGANQKFMVRTGPVLHTTSRQEPRTEPGWGPKNQNCIEPEPWVWFASSRFEPNFRTKLQQPYCLYRSHPIKVMLTKAQIWKITQVCITYELYAAMGRECEFSKFQEEKLHDYGD